MEQLSTNDDFIPYSLNILRVKFFADSLTTVHFLSFHSRVAVQQISSHVVAVKVN